MGDAWNHLIGAICYGATGRARMGFGAASLLYYLIATEGVPGEEELVVEPLLLLILLLLVSTGVAVVATTVAVVFYYYSRYFRALSIGEMHRACTLLR